MLDLLLIVLEKEVEVVVVVVGGGATKAVVNNVVQPALVARKKTSSALVPESVVNKCDILVIVVQYVCFLLFFHKFKQCNCGTWRATLEEQRMLLLSHISKNNATAK